MQKDRKPLKIFSVTRARQTVLYSSNTHHINNIDNNTVGLPKGASCQKFVL